MDVKATPEKPVAKSNSAVVTTPSATVMENLSTNKTKTPVDVSRVPAYVEKPKELCQVERKKKKKIKSANRTKSPQQPCSPQLNTVNDDLAEQTVDHVAECEPQHRVELASSSSPSTADVTPQVSGPQLKQVEECTTREAEQKAMPSVPSVSALAQASHHHYHQPQHTGAWYSPFSTGLQLDILPRQQPSYSNYSNTDTYESRYVPTYANVSGLAANHRRHYQHSSLPTIPRASSPRSLVGRERLPERTYRPFTPASFHQGYMHDPIVGMENSRWRAVSRLPMRSDAERATEFSLFDKAWPRN